MLYDGRHKGMDEDFKDELVVVIEHLLNRKNLVTKRVNNHYFDGTEFLDYLENLIEIFQSDKLPKTQTIYEMTVERQMSRLVDSCLQSYKNLIKNDLNTVTNLSMIKKLHNKCEAQALLMFNNSNKMGNNEHEIKYKGTLVNDINKEFNQWKIEKEFIFKELNLIRLQQERIHQEEMAKIRAEKTAAKARLDAKRREIESALERSRIVREKELKKERQRDAERQREQEKALECQRRNAERRLEQLRLKSEAERNRFREQEQFNITYFKCNSCDLVVKYSDLHRYSSSAHDFRVCDPTEMFLNQLQDSGLPQMLTRILNRFFNLDLEED
ncbi:unnamed protein product [Chironomus riparius]|uniref:Uncharacterized protein n=1 Tax=Chironomus riparius TaxID=315576 RepID=A0A9N9S9Y9_9DIPT|nr:unnamed protein product [Chironomus riparius]